MEKKLLDNMISYMLISGERWKTIKDFVNNVMKNKQTDGLQEYDPQKNEVDKNLMGYEELTYMMVKAER